MKFAESFKVVHDAYTQINFAAYDFDTVKNSLIEYIRINYPEDFNNFLENDHLIMFIETIAYVAELLAFRMDMNANENLITSTQRKASILNLATLTAYKPIRNIAGSGLLKIKTISTTSNVYDSNGFNLSGNVIQWNDSNNTNWFNQFVTVINDFITSSYGQPGSSYNNGTNSYEIYNINSAKNKSGIIPFTQTINNNDYDYESVPCQFDDYGNIVEQFPDKENNPSLLYISNNNSGDSGFYLYSKQGTLMQEVAQFSNSIINRTYSPSTSNINSSDVWVVKVDANNTTLDRWIEVNNILYNDANTKNIFEIETLENDRINIHFGGQTSNIPQGLFSIYSRRSANTTLVSTPNEFNSVIITEPYYDAVGNTQYVTIELQMTTILSNSTSTQSVNDIRENAVGIYGTNDRMVSGADYNNWIKQLPGIKTSQTINRTYIGDSLFSDSSLEYMQVSLAGTDLMSYMVGNNLSKIANVQPDKIIDQVITPLLVSPGLINSIILEQSLYLNSSDRYDKHRRNAQIRIRKSLIDDFNTEYQLASGMDNPKPLLEKTLLQGYIDQHFYGSSNRSTTTVMINDQTVNSATPLFIVNAYYNDNGMELYHEKLYDAYKLICVPVYNFDERNPIYRTVTSTLDASISGMQTNIPVQNSIALRYEMFTNKLSDGALTKIFNVDTSDAWITLRVSSVIDANVSFELINSSTSRIDTFNYSINNMQHYDFGYVQFTLDGSFDSGDTFVFNLNNVAGVYATNTLGVWTIVDKPFSTVFNPQQSDWHIFMEKTFDPSGKVLWNIYYRNVITNIYSKNIQIDASTQAVLDRYNQSGNSDYVTINSVDLKTTRDSSNSINVNGYKIPNYFSKFIDPMYIGNNIIYTKIINGKKVLIPQPANIPFNPNNILDNSPIVTNFDIYNRYLTLNQKPLQFVYNHFVSNDIMINPSTTNIHDVFVVTDNYYYAMMNYLLTGINKPSVDSRITAYDDIINKHKTMSDEVIVRGAEIVPVLGIRSDAQYQVQIIVTKDSHSKSNNSIINSIITYISSLPMMNIGQVFFLSKITRGILNNIDGISDVVINAGFTRIIPDENQLLIPYVNEESIIIKMSE